MGVVKSEHRKILVPVQRLGTIKKHWAEIYRPLVDEMKLQVRMCLKTKLLEMRTCAHTADDSAVQRGEDFVHAVLAGFSPEDSLVLLRLDGMFVEGFEIKDVRTLKNDHLPRAIGRIIGTSGKTKKAIENGTKTRVVVFGTKISLLGSEQNIRTARDAVCDLILGKPPGKIYNRLRVLAARKKERELF
ncbi:MAG: RNA-binding protein PNO1 [Amphiamblys sp. WSBS2006]|nr:MAG: RNA-binding protein PNO1 [Amphiamblys sp. WSBS2006]